MSDAGLGLEKIGNLSSLLSAADSAKTPIKTPPKEHKLALKLVSEDPANPREYFDPEALGERIRARGKLISPISVRSNPDKPGHHIVNHGHRRFRACRLISRSNIEAFIDESFSDEDQVIENIHREAPHMIEIANYVGRKMSMGLKQREIARKIGKTQPYVSMYAQVLESSVTISTAIHKGVIADILTAYELIKLAKHHPAEVEKYITDQSAITRTDVAMLRQVLANKIIPPSRPEASDGQAAADDAGEPGNGEGEDDEKIPAEAPRRKTLSSPVITVTKSKRRATFILNREPKSPRHVWIRYETGVYGEAEVPLKSLQLVSIKDGA